jgi:TolB-like protein
MSVRATRVVILGFSIFFLCQPAFTQGPAVNTLSSGLSEIATRSGRKTVAVVDFTDLQGCVTELGRYMAEDVSVALASNAKGFEVVDRTNLKILMQEHKLASSGIIDPATARQLGKVAGVDALITGTIAPLSDSVHISAKVLDTETARILGGITADIPRTRAVEELLAKGVTNCGQGANPGSGQQAVSTVPAPSATTTAQIGAGFQISITGCRREGDWVRCSGSVLNRTADPISMRFNGGSFFIDNLGNQSVQGEVEFQLGSGGDRTEVEPDIPVKVLMSAKGLSGQATSVSLMLNVYRPEGKILLRNIPIQPN